MRIIKLLKLKFDRFDARYLLRFNNLSDVDNSNDSLNAILPTQTGNSGKALVTDGTDTSWSSAGVSDHGSLTGLDGDDHTQYVLDVGDTMTGDLIGTSFVSTRSGTITRDGDGLISSVALTGGRTLTLSRDVNDAISSITDGTRTWTITRDGDGLISSWAVT